jgi:thymidylate synthase ThyX
MTTTTSAKIICDSISPAGHRLTTFECVFPRIILAEVNTHRVLSRNSASSRAIPIEKMIQRVLEDPYVPTHWGKNQRGMQAERDVDSDSRNQAEVIWFESRDDAIGNAQRLLDVGIHKQITNRLLEPFMWHTALVTGTEWSNFFNLRDNKDAHPDFRDLAHAMRELRAKSEPIKRGYQDWHTPLAWDEDLDGFIDDARNLGLPDPNWDELRCKVSVGRCARVSYLTHDGKRDPQADVDLCERLLSSGHMSPFEHVARPMTDEELDLFAQKKMVWNGEKWIWHGEKRGKFPNEFHDPKNDWSPEYGEFYEGGEYTHFLGNVNGWVQYRKLIPHEQDILGERN